jgi:Tfp pilus assembly protein PilV
MKRWNADAGFSTVEAVIAAAVTAAGTLGVAGLFIMGTRMQSIARHGSGATGVATARLERLRMLPVSALERSNGGTLTGPPAANHFAVEGPYQVRWSIVDGPAGTKQVTVRVSRTGNAGAAGATPTVAEVRTLLWR